MMCLEKETDFFISFGVCHGDLYFFRDKSVTRNLYKLYKISVMKTGNTNLNRRVRKSEEERKVTVTPNPGLTVSYQ